MSYEIGPADRSPERRILRRAEVEQKTGFKRAHLYSLMRAGKFPKALRLGIRAVGWDSAELDKWIADRLNHRVSMPRSHGAPCVLTGTYCNVCSTKLGT
jgi:prophage regulatory protein